MDRHGMDRGMIDVDRKRKNTGIHLFLRWTQRVPNKEQDQYGHHENGPYPPIPQWGHRTLA
jgi:hypothetical protein